MRYSEPRIDGLRVRGYRVPTDAAEADGTLGWDSTGMLLVEVSAAGHRGLGYSYTEPVSAAALVRDTLAPLLHERCAFDLPAHWQTMRAALRNAGRPGLGMMAIAAVDVALWDLKARLLGLSLASLWGVARDSVPLYGSGGFTRYDDERLARQLGGWAEQGLSRVKMKIGSAPADDPRRLRVARDAIGPDVELMVDANGAFTPRRALAMGEALRASNVCWYEEPVSSDDPDGLAWLRDRVPPAITIAAGEYGWEPQYFRRLLECQAVDVLQADATRCGYTGFLRTAALCEAFQRPLSAHCAPALHAPVCAAAPRLAHLEYFHDHVRIESRFFDGLPALHQGDYRIDPSAVGHGLKLREADAEPFRVPLS